MKQLPTFKSFLRSFRNPFTQILCAIASGIVLGYLAPERAMQMRPLGDVFIAIIRVMVGPVIFCTVTAGIAAMRNTRQLGHVGIKAIVYFEVLSMLALLTGMAGAWLLQPGAGFRLDGTVPAAALATLPAHATNTSLLTTLQAAFLNNSILQLLLCAVASGIALALLGERTKRITDFCEQVSTWLFWIVNLVLKAAPLAAFGAVAYIVGRHGVLSVGPLLQLLGALYLTTFLFVLVVLGLIARWCGFSIWRFVVYIREELMIVIATSSSVAAMPRLIEKLRHAGCPAPVAGIVIPAGYSFNLNGSNIYLTLALSFLAQAAHIELGLVQYASIFAVAMISSKGSSGVAGSAFIALSATLAAVPGIPDSGLLFIVGIERLLKCRSLANIIGNGVGCIAVSAWTGQLDRARLMVMAKGG